MGSDMERVARRVRATGKPYLYRRGGIWFCEAAGNICAPGWTKQEAWELATDRPCDAPLPAWSRVVTRNAGVMMRAVRRLVRCRVRLSH